jgi:uncharacterized membrane protein YgcG
VFEHMLPYAMALQVTGAWARRFQGIYEEGAAAAPVWYTGMNLTSPHGGFSTSSLGHSLSAAMTDTAGAMVAAPRAQGSSGFGGGGAFSGGGGGFSGGGGGGGGSW